MSDDVLVVRGLGKAYRDYASEWLRVVSWFGASPRPRHEHWVLRDVSFAVRRGESIGLVGRNGAGKSTLLKLIAGTLRPSAGDVETRGRIAAILELGMGFNPEFTGRQNAIHAAGLMGYDHAAILRTIEEIERFADIGEYFDQPVRIYSSGMQMRVAFAVATAFTPDLLLIDEALAVGDLSFQAKCFARIEAMRRQGSTLLYVSHSVEEVVKHCERSLLVDAGRLVLDDDSRVVANTYLDLIWGRNRGGVARRGASAGDYFGSGGEDRFATRPFYRREEHRWGDGGARIVDYVLAADSHQFPSPIRAGEELRVAMRVVFDQDVPCPVYGLLVKTHDGVFLYGTNSKISAGAAPPAVAGQIVDVEFRLSAALNSGSFLLSLGVSSEDAPGELRPLDRRYDAILINVVHDQPLWGIVDLGADCRILESVSSA